MTYTPTPEAIEAAAVAIYGHHWGGGWSRRVDSERELYRDRATAALTAAAPFIQAEAMRDHKALTKAAVDMAAVSGSPAHHVIAAIFSVSKLQDQAKVEALREAAQVLDRAEYARPESPERDHYNAMLAIRRGGTTAWLRNRAATIEGKSE